MDLFYFVDLKCIYLFDFSVKVEGRKDISYFIILSLSFFNC